MLQMKSGENLGGIGHPVLSSDLYIHVHVRTRAHTHAPTPHEHTNTHTDTDTHTHAHTHRHTDRQTHTHTLLPRETMSLLSFFAQHRSSLRSLSPE